MTDEEKKEYEEAKLYLEHTGVDDFNLEKHQCENRKWAIETALKIIEKQEKIINVLANELEEKSTYMSKEIWKNWACRKVEDE